MALNTIAPVSTLAVSTLFSGIALVLAKPLSPLLAGCLLISGSNLVSTAASLAIGHLVDKKIMYADDGLGLTIALSLLAFIVNAVVFTLFIASPALLMASMAVSLLTAAFNLPAAFHRVELQVEEASKKNVRQLESRLEQSKNEMTKLEELGDKTVKQRQKYMALRAETVDLTNQIRALRGQR